MLHTGDRWAKLLGPFFRLSDLVFLKKQMISLTIDSASLAPEPQTKYFVGSSSNAVPPEANRGVNIKQIVVNNFFIFPFLI